MPNPVKVAVHVDRGDAIRAGRNSWGWLPTELDLDTLQQKLRDALALCAEEDGVLLITHVASPPGTRAGDENAALMESQYGFLRRHRDSRALFDCEREGAPKAVEASPDTALAALIHLAGRPERALAKAVARRAELLAQAQEEHEAVCKVALEAVEALDAWLAKPADEAVVENKAADRPEHRFDALPPPEKPQLGDYWGLLPGEQQFRNEWNRVVRVIASKGVAEVPVRGDLFAAVGDQGEEGEAAEENLTPSWGRVAQEFVATAWEERSGAVEKHWRDAYAAAVRRSREYAQAEHDAFMAAAAARRAADQARRDAALAADLARREAAQNAALLAWAERRGHGELAELVRAGHAEGVADALRAAVFEHGPRDFPRFKKITKADLLLANPGFRDDAALLEAEFEEEDARDMSGHPRAGEIATRLVEAEVPAQYRIRVHRGFLRRKGALVGTPVEARSVLVTASFGALSVSRAFAIGDIGPVVK